VQETDVECCGMAGSFGYKEEYYELSMRVGEDLRRQMSANGAEEGGEELPVLAASGTSCVEQIGALFDRKVVHPIELVAPPADPGR
jgi:Fe-S oxidoreductase